MMFKHSTLPKMNQLAASIALVVGGLTLMPAAYAASPAAGTNISNVATASYTDGTNTSRTVTSNSVNTVVLQVASFDLQADRTTTANPNGQVSLSHTLTNLGNGTDTFQLNVANVSGDDYDFTNVHVYLDANNDGVPDNNTDLNGTAISLPAGQSVGLVVVGTTSNVATNAQVGDLALTATNVFSTTVSGGSNTATTKTNTDVVTIVAGAVIQLAKSINVTNVDPTASTLARTVTYTLAYKNTGNADASNVTVTDLLPANVTYVPGSAVWSGSATALTDDTSSDGPSIAYDFNKTTAGTATLVLNSVPKNTNGTLTFKVTVNANAPAGTIVNTGYVDPDGTGPQPSQPSNPAILTVNSILLGTINDSQADNYSDANTIAGNLAKDNTILASTTQGTPINFGNNGGETIWVHNTGNVDELYNFSVDKSALPAGSIVEILKSDGQTPFTNTDSDPSVDTGPIAAGSALQVVVRVTYPSGYTTTTPISAIVTVTPAGNTTATDTIVLTTTAITSAKVDLSNGTGNKNNTDDDTPSAGEGPYNAAKVIDTKTTNPNQATTFPIAVTNIGTNPDNFNISASTLPAGWSVAYFTTDGSGNCTTNQVTNTGNIAPGATVSYCAVVTPPAGAKPSDSTDVVFTVFSPATGLTDSLKDHVTVAAVRNLAMTPDRQGQIAPGGTIIYTHTLTNTGNVTEGTGTSVLTLKDPSLSHGSSTLGATTSVYVDLNNNGIADANELVTDFTAGDTGAGSINALLATGLQSGASINILVKVQAPANATAGQQDLSTIVVTPSGTVNGTAATAPVQVVDLTTVNLGQVRLDKTQALDADCNGTADTAFGLTTIQAKPGACVIYQINAVNDGNASVSNVAISDGVPAYTSLLGSPTVTPSAKASATVSGSFITTTTTPVGGFTLAPTESTLLQFEVKINP
jgi:uncharacterized repeat protein (TIGR01451 family)